MTFSPGDHIRQHPDSLTEESMKILSKATRAWHDGLSAQRRIALYRNAVNAFAIPSELCMSYRRLYTIVQQMAVVARRAWDIKQRDLQPGQRVFDPDQLAEVKILKVRKDFMLKIEGRSHGVCSSQLLSV